MAVYGIGATFEKKDVFDFFIKDKVAFLSWTDKDAPELHKLFRHVKIGDILYIKSYNPTTGLTIKAIGIVKDNAINEANNNNISVGWIWIGKKDTEKVEDQFIVLEPNMDKYNVRNIAIYEEFNEVVLAKVLDKIFAATNYK